MSEVVVITGASSGVGRALAIRYAQDGAKVGLVARGRQGLEGAARDVEAAGGQAHTISADVADADQVEAAAAEFEDELGPIDTWVNCAIVTVYSRIMDMTPDEFRRVMDVNFLGVVNGTQAALRRFIPRDQGTLVQVGSALAYQGIPLQSAYCASKAAVKNFTESLRTELMNDRSNIQLTIVHLPGLNTPQFTRNRAHIERQPQPVPPIFQPEVAAEGIHHAATSGVDEFWVAGATVKTIAGNKFASRLTGVYLAATGEKSQKTDDLLPPDRPDNLFEPLDGDPGVHGPFDDQAKERSIQLELNERKGQLVAAGAAVAALAGGVAYRRRRNGG